MSWLPILGRLVRSTQVEEVKHLNAALLKRRLKIKHLEFCLLMRILDVIPPTTHIPMHFTCTAPMTLALTHHVTVKFLVCRVIVPMVESLSANRTSRCHPVSWSLVVLWMILTGHSCSDSQCVYGNETYSWWEWSYFFFPTLGGKGA